MCSTCSRKDMIWDADMQEEKKTLLSNIELELNLIYKSGKYYIEAATPYNKVRYNMNRCITCGKLYG